MEDTLEKLYYDVSSPASFSGVTKLYKEAKKTLSKITHKDVRNWLKKQYTYTLHRPVKRKYRRSKYFVSDIDELWQIDLADMAMISNVNDNAHFLLTCIDVFSKYAWVRVVKSKSSRDVTDAFAEILQLGRIPKKLQSDKGTEFLNTKFQKLLKTHGISFFTCNNPDIKCSIVERFNRTIKTKIWKYFTKNRTYKYVDVLDQFVHAYNSSPHSSTHLTPIAASDSNNRHRVYHNLYHEYKFSSNKARLTKGDFVRISKTKGLFEKGYLPNWSEEIFVIDKVVNSNPPKYFLSDLLEERVTGGFYEPEIQEVTKPESYWVEKVIKTRKRKGKKEILVKWLGYPKKFNSWITEKDGFLPLPT